MWDYAVITFSSAAFIEFENLDYPFYATESQKLTWTISDLFIVQN